MPEIRCPFLDLVVGLETFHSLGQSHVLPFDHVSAFEGRMGIEPASTGYSFADDKPSTLDVHMNERTPHAVKYMVDALLQLERPYVQQLQDPDRLADRHSIDGSS